MRTTQGPQRVDVIYRRIDDDFLDPLVFRPDSVLGVPGLMSAYHAGNRHARPTRSARASPTTRPSTPTCRRSCASIIGEEPILKNVPTWRCREKDALSYVLDHLHELVVKEVNGSGGYGMLVGPHATQGSRSRSSGAKLHADPGQLHRPADAGALDLPDLRRRRRRPAPRRSAALRAHGRQGRASCRAG